MKHRLAALLLATLIPLTLLTALLLWSPTAVSATPSHHKIDTTLTQLPPTATIRVIIQLHPQTDLNQPQTSSKLARRQTIINQLQQTAVSTQAPLQQLLTQQQQAGLVQHSQPLWIINAIAATLSPSTLPAIAALPSVAAILPDTQLAGFPPPVGMPAPAPPLSSTNTLPTWGVERVGAPLVWDGLDVRGDGIVVAIMDSGVDWTHPLLRPGYRGLAATGTVDHGASWYSPANPTLTEPTDLIGHGTHVAGTAVGQNGIGVAPNARWIAVNITDPDGLIFSSAILQGFQWLLAPGGNPALAPDIINNSWSGEGSLAIFDDAVTTLRASGILPLFAVGNDGSTPATVGSPASYPHTLAIGASDTRNAVAWFSSRGPSPLTSQPKPTLVGPGTAVLSAYPGNQLQTLNGTSMATPHASGVAALLLAANPTLDPATTTTILTQTAVSLTPLTPNNDSGWGRLDAYAAVASQRTTGQLEGSLRHQGAPLPHTAYTLTLPSGRAIGLQTDSNGQFSLPLAAGSYGVQTAVFGHQPTNHPNLTINTNQTTPLDLNLTPLPSGTVEGHILTINGHPITATITVSNTPATTMSDKNGRFQLTLPSGRHELIVRAPGYHLGRTTVQISTGQTQRHNFTLDPAPTILLVDSGHWYYQSQANYYEQALLAAGYHHDTAPIYNPFSDIPPLTTLRNYDIVIWSAPRDAPGQIGANNVLTDYLGAGGKLLISGQEVGFIDGAEAFPQPWFFRQLGARFDSERRPTTAVSSLPNTPFSNLTFDLNGGSSANNQTSPDSARLRPNKLTHPIFRYDDGENAGLWAGHCTAYQILYFGFGLEGVRHAADRTTLLQHSLTHLQNPTVTHGITLTPHDINDFVVPGDSYTYTISLRNLSETMTETFHLQPTGASWPTHLLTPTLTLGPCQTAVTSLRLTVPPDVGKDVSHKLTLTAVSTTDPTNQQQITLHHKTPGRFLLVDDDRWYDQQPLFVNALAANGIHADVWETASRGSPPLPLLQQYEYLIWFTGYDWFAPVTAAENETLAAYLQNNGRLFLNSQDYLYYNLNTPLAVEHFGIISQSESITPTTVYADPALRLPPALAGPLPLSYEPYQNFSDGLILAPQTTPFLWHNQGTPAGTARAGDTWRAVFWDVPLETLPTAVHTTALGTVLGWLSPWGDTRFVADTQTGAPGTPRSYTLTLHSDTPTRTVALTNSLPTGLTLLPATLSGGANYNPTTRQLTWRGTVSHSHTIHYQAIPQDSSQPPHNVVVLHDEQDGVRLTRTASVWPNAPDLRSAQLTAVAAPTTAPPTLTYTLVLTNNGLAPASPATIDLRLPDATEPITATLHSSSGTSQLKGQRIHWQPTLAPGDTATTTIVLRYTPNVEVWLAGTAVIDDGSTTPIIKHLQQYLPPHQYFFPFVFRQKPV